MDHGDWSQGFVMMRLRSRVLGDGSAIVVRSTAAAAAVEAPATRLTCVRKRGSPPPWVPG